MALIVYGRKIRETSSEVAYTYGSDPNNADGTLVIPVDDVDSWHVEGKPAGAKPVAAKRIAGKAYLVHSKTGSWPDDASFYA